VLECRPSSQREGSSPQAQAETNQRHDQQEGGKVKQQLVPLRRRFDRRLVVSEQRVVSLIFLPETKDRDITRR